MLARLCLALSVLALGACDDAADRDCDGVPWSWLAEQVNDPTDEQHLGGPLVALSDGRMAISPQDPQPHLSFSVSTSGSSDLVFARRERPN